MAGRSSAPTHARPDAPVGALAAGLDAVLVVDAESGDVVWASDLAAELMATSVAALAAYHLADAFAESRDVATVLAKGDRRVLDVHLSGDGKAGGRAVEFWVRPAGDKRVVTLLDAHERRRLDDKRIEQAEELLQVVRLLPDVIFSCYKGEDGKIYWSLNEGKLAEEFGVTTEEIRGKPLEELFPGGASEHIRKEFEDAFAGTAKEWVNEMGGRYFKHFPQPVCGPDGEVEKVVGFISEVTNLKKAQEEIEQLNAKLDGQVRELDEANKQLEAFAYTVSHDLRTPLTVLQNLLQVLELKFGDALGDEGGDLVDRLRSSTRRMSRLIEDLLALSRAWRQPLKITDVDLGHVAAQVVAELRERDPDRDVTVEIEPSLAARAGPGFARVVMDNLIGNAWKYTSQTPAARIEVGRTRDGSVYVRDNGPGFEPAEAERVFLAFERLDAAKDFEGTGIGLATVRRIAERHGGRVWAEGRPGRGATFYVRFEPEAAA